MIVPIQEWILPSSGHQMPGRIRKSLFLSVKLRRSTRHLNVFTVIKLGGFFLLKNTAVKLLLWNLCASYRGRLHYNKANNIQFIRSACYSIHLAKPPAMICVSIPNLSPGKTRTLQKVFSILIYFSIYATFPTSSWFLNMFYSTIWPILTYWGTPRKQWKKKINGNFSFKPPTFIILTFKFKSKLIFLSSSSPLTLLPFSLQVIWDKQSICIQQ